MGVRSLWRVLSSVRVHTPMNNLRGLTLAVDLSIWIVEAQQVAQRHGMTVAKPYLR